MTYVSWFNQTRTRLKNEGVKIGKRKHTFSPVPKGRTWVKGTCPHCSSGNGFVFWDDNCKSRYLLACQRCGKDTIKGGKRG